MSHAETPRVPFMMLAVLVLSLALPAPGHTHARLIETVPAEGSVLSSPPETLRLVFSESIEVRFSRFALMRLPHDQSADDARRRQLVAALTDSALPEEAVLLMPVDAEQRAAAITLTPPAPPGPGRYILVWLAFSVDGHHTSGTVAFEIAAPGNG